jgi:hypothetical protein
VLQAASSFDGMASKTKVVDVSDAFDLADTMSVGDIFGKKNLRRIPASSATCRRKLAQKRQEGFC